MMSIYGTKIPVYCRGNWSGEVPYGDLTLDLDASFHAEGNRIHDENYDDFDLTSIEVHGTLTLCFKTDLDPITFDLNDLDNAEVTTLMDIFDLDFHSYNWELSDGF